MKNFLFISDRFATTVKVVALLTIISFSSFQKAEADVYRGVSFQVFYDELMPYGDWVQDPHHGFVWIPYVEQNFHPYSTRGHWMMTSYGNTWVSQYDWGWAPFHYGRWFHTNYYGWAWVPGYEWGPAWVNWRTGGGYYGWAPLAPGLHINMAYNMPYNHYVFVQQRRLMHRNMHRYFLPRTHVVNVFNHTTIINNTYVNNQRTYISGPDRRELERVSRRSVPVYQVNNANNAGRASVNNRSVALYRPDVERGTVTQARPSRMVASSDYNRSTARSAAPANNQRQSQVRQEAPRGNGQELRRAPQANSSGNRQNAVRSNEAVRSAAPARTASPATVQRTAPAQNNNRVSTPRQNNVSNRETTAIPRQQAAQPSQRNTAPRINTSAQPVQTRQAAPTQQQRQVTAPAPNRQSNPAVRSSSAQRTAPAVSNSRSSSRTSAAQPSGQTSTRSNSRSSRGNN